jgi:hypothetical protein
VREREREREVGREEEREGRWGTRDLDYHTNSESRSGYPVGRLGVAFLFVRVRVQLEGIEGKKPG